MKKQTLEKLLGVGPIANYSKSNSFQKKSFFYILTGYNIYFLFLSKPFDKISHRRIGMLYLVYGFITVIR